MKYKSASRIGRYEKKEVIGMAGRLTPRSNQFNMTHFQKSIFRTIQNEIPSLKKKDVLALAMEYESEQTWNGPVMMTGCSIDEVEKWVRKNKQV